MINLTVELNIAERTRRSAMRRRVSNILLGICAFTFIALILWLDVATGFWADLVVLSGLAAGGVTFVLTALVFNRLNARRIEQRWEPVTRLALTEFLHAIADEQRSEVASGSIVPRRFESFAGDEVPSGAQLHGLREQVVTERQVLTEALSRWASFLAASGNCEGVLRHIASIALHLDILRDTTLEVERAPSGTPVVALNTAISNCNDRIAALQAELQGLLDAHRTAALAAS